MYLKDLSLEQPNSPQILLEQQHPQVEINLGMGAEPMAEGVFEVTVTATVTTKIGDKALFLVEAKQAGIFEIRNVPDEQMQGIISVVCPQMIYPYLRAIVSDVCTRAGFPPIILAEVNFQAMFEAQQAQAAAQNGNGRRASSPAPTDAGPTPTPARPRMNISMLGAGAWGTALAMAAARRHDVLLWTRDAQQAAQMNAQRRNHPLPARVAFSRRVEGRCRPRCRFAPCAWRAAGHRHTDGRVARAAACVARGRAGAVAVQGLRSGYR